MKLYQCELCNNNVKIRSTIKIGDNKGLKVCSICAFKNREKKISDKTRKTNNQRKERRKDYPEFYERMCNQARGEKCVECGKTLLGNSTEVPHILSKSLSEEVATNEDNILKWLCGDCHTIFDSNFENRSKMKCFEKSLEQYKKIKPKLINITSETIYYDRIFKEKFA